MAKRVTAHPLDIQEARTGQSLVLPLGSRFVSAIEHDGQAVLLFEEPDSQQTETWVIAVRRPALPSVPKAHADYPNAATLLAVIQSLRLVVLRVS